MKMIAHNNQGPRDILQVWAKVERRLKTYTPEQMKQSLIDSGILTKNGNVAKPYKKTFRPIKKTPAASRRDPV